MKMVGAKIGSNLIVKRMYHSITSTTACQRLLHWW